MGLLRKFLPILLVTFQVIFPCQSQTWDYYGKDFFNNLNSYARNKILKAEIYKVLNNFHVHQENHEDLILSECPANTDCYAHKSYSYKTARTFLFGNLHLQKDQQGLYIKDVYCNYKFRNSDFPSRDGLGEGQIPSSRIINAEHTWPQSKFNTRERPYLQKSDLHALFPSSSEANSLRSNYDFQELDNITASVCNKSAKGTVQQSSEDFFEPPQEHKGNVARALFYFAVHYNMEIKDSVENTLRLWHLSDPVDSEEIERHEKVFDFQQVRNPFIDHPDLVNLVDNF